MATERGRVYWLAQNELEHTPPDWKIHFSLAPRGEWKDDIGLGWNILAALFLERCCEAGMKVRYEAWDDEKQRGRELTVYVYQFSERYDEGHQGGPMAGLSEDGQEHVHYLGYEMEAPYEGTFWFDFIRDAEERFRAAGLQSAGVADGDMALPGCEFASLRNEAFVPVPNPQHREDNRIPPTMLVYPPNDWGWNGAQHENPLADTVGVLEEHARVRASVEREASRRREGEQATPTVRAESCIVRVCGVVG